jgi:ribosome-binding factor A
MSTLRQNKYARLLQKELGEYFRKEARNFSPGSLISITIVRISPDLAEAKVYLSFFQVANKEKVLEDVISKTREIRHWLGEQIRHQARVTPNLQFYLDDSIDYAENIDRLLNQPPTLPI